MCPTVVARQISALVLLCCILAVPGATSASAAPLSPLSLGFADGVYGEQPPVRDPWLQRTVDAGAQFVLISANWRTIAPAAPNAAFRPDDPADPAYRWAPTDDAIRAAAARGLDVVVTVIYAPAWAEGPDRPPDARPGSWRPDPAAYAAFATAIARRYSGAFGDPANPGQSLPRVRFWQAWAEPNLMSHLAPQWEGSGPRAVPVGPEVYRRLLNAFYGAVKAIHADNTVVTGGTAPFGDPAPGGPRMPPALFVRTLLCESDSSLRTTPCPSPARFDVLAHDPYTAGSPRHRALNLDDVSVPDLGKLTKPLRAAERTGRVFPQSRKRLWVTEISWDSNPPDPMGVPVELHARWLTDAFYLMWHQGVERIAWFLVRDQAGPPFDTTFQSGVYFIDGTPKPALSAYRFPFASERASRGRRLLWGRAPVAGRVVIERRAGRRWRPLARVAARAGQVFAVKRRLAGRPALRARVGAETSLVWKSP